MEDLDTYLLKFKGYYFDRPVLDMSILENLEDFEIRDDDVFLITYPKSGTIWTQQILSLIYYEDHRNNTSQKPTLDLIPFLEYNLHNVDFINSPSPRLFTSHLPYYLVPNGLKKKKAKIIYVYRNPKDVMNSYFHFSKFVSVLEPIKDIEEFMKRFLDGKVVGSLWFDHVRDWYKNKHHFNILFMMYEDMTKDLRSAVLKICRFLEKELSDVEVDVIVKQLKELKNKLKPRVTRLKDALGKVQNDPGSIKRRRKVSPLQPSPQAAPQPVLSTTLGLWCSGGREQRQAACGQWPEGRGGGDSARSC
ncbi:PREDICTED: amine sulfotransferase-like [Elephantulus edwardii]|uniref:amine sulfotransferase-like n=1 Tax=Elephantulus edwardii TaxID=28737 RepID=UPI0003F06493|nr:PREDICTED: amine sulfotransferase-like [Elephantulus edwardii]